jgi:hypothetical protein
MILICINVDRIKKLQNLYKNHLKKRKEKKN